MRQLILHRERALACFAVRYHCILDQDRDAFLHWLEGQDQLALMVSESDHALRNGETISIGIGEGGGTFFVAAYLEKRNIVTEQVTVPPGDADVSYVIRTDFDGNRRLSISVVPDV